MTKTTGIGSPPEVYQRMWNEEVENTDGDGPMDPFITAGFVLHNPEDSEFTALDSIEEYRGFELGEANELSPSDGADLDVIFIRNPEDGTIYTMPETEYERGLAQKVIDAWHEAKERDQLSLLEAAE